MAYVENRLESDDFTWIMITKLTESEVFSATAAIQSWDSLRSSRQR